VRNIENAAKVLVLLFHAVTVKTGTTVLAGNNLPATGFAFIKTEQLFVSD
jgi:hypothetical protein